MTNMFKNKSTDLLKIILLGLARQPLVHFLTGKSCDECFTLMAPISPTTLLNILEASVYASDNISVDTKSRRRYRLGGQCVCH